MRLVRCGIAGLLCGAVAIVIFCGVSSQAWAQAADKSAIDKTPVKDPVPGEREKAVPARDSNLVVQDTIDTDILQPDSLAEPALVTEPVDTTSMKEELPIKTFRGTGQDVIIGALTIFGWLFFMWLAANQGPN